MLELAPEHATAESAGLDSVLAEIETKVAPLWPLKDYVAVNPFLGFSGEMFLDGLHGLRAVRNCEFLPSSEYFRELFAQGEITNADVEKACQQCFQEYPDLYTGISPRDILDQIEQPSASGRDAERWYRTVSEVVDQRLGSSWTSHIINDITRHCAAHYDEGQAIWPNPWRELPLYQAWHEAARLSRRMDLLGITGFHRLVAQLPQTPAAAIRQLLDALDIPQEHWHGFLLSEVFSVAGWASYVKYRGREAERFGSRNEDLVGLLAIRLAYDAALAQTGSHDPPLSISLYPVEADSSRWNDACSPSLDILARYSLQVAAEGAYRRQLCRALTTGDGTPARSSRSAAQLVFCIDVRSEVIRRHLERVEPSIETFGFAGFFGMPLEYVPLGDATGPAQCPVLLLPVFRVHECLLGAEAADQVATIIRRRTRRTARKVWKLFQTTATSCFSFVESLGLLYFGKLLTDSLQLTRPVASGQRDGLKWGSKVQLGPDLYGHASDYLSSDQRIDLAEGMLHNLGLTGRFARIVALCGHGAEVSNNPYKAGLDCGACGGHSGEPNARFAAALLNDPAVRTGLAERGIHIPDDTWFVPGVHNTTTDEIRFHDTATIPDTHAAELAQLTGWVKEAGARSRSERSRRLGNVSAGDLFRRSRDWSEVRPEWGLAGNASFIVAPRSRTERLNLGGRAFMHSYDHRKDPVGKVLELIMTAPMVVTNWINLQYYASAVDNRAFGSGDKVLHNVVGQFGTLLGNGGDLMTGLPWQSVHDGERFQHEPLRLLVVIESPREAVQQIIGKHQLVRDLVSNGWLSLVALDEEQFYRWNSDGQWRVESVELQPPSSDAELATTGVGEFKTQGGR